MDEAGRRRRFHYDLLIDPLPVGQLLCENYGVRVWEEEGEEKQVRGITTSAVRIDELLSLLVEGGVGPTTLPEVVQDWL